MISYLWAFNLILNAGNLNDAFSELAKKHFTEDEIKNNKLNIQLPETFDIELPEENACNACETKIGKKDLTYNCS